MNRLLDALQRQLRPQVILGLLVSCVCLVVLAGYLYLLKPGLARYRELSLQQSDDALRLAVETAPALAEGIARTELEVAQLQDRLYGGSSTVPPREMESWVIRHLDRISERHRVELVSVTPVPGTPVLTFRELPYDVHVQGSYFALFAWLHEVEDELRPMAVKTFEMTGEAKDQVAMRLRLASYRPGGGGA